MLYNNNNNKKKKEKKGKEEEERGKESILLMFEILNFIGINEKKFKGCYRWRR